VTELLAAVLGAVVGGVIAYSFGKRQGREQTVYEEQARTVIQIRHMLREVQSKIYEWSIPYESEYRLDIYPSRPVQGRAIFQELENLSTYYTAQEPWLESRTRETFKEIQGVLYKKCFDFFDVIDPINPPDESTLASLAAEVEAEEEEHATALNEWISESNLEGYGGLKEKWDQEAERVVGGRPWWRRWFS
jgi:hypothetical protein